jgi:hypothetical protein
MKDMMGNSIADDAEFDDLDDFDYVDQFIGKDDDGDDASDSSDELDDLDDLYVDEGDEADELGNGGDEFEDEEPAISEDEDINDMDEELEAKFICEDCGHKWLDFVTETDEENDLLETSCPLCGSQNVSMER